MSGETSFCHLHVHSYFSFLEGVPSPAQLAQAAKQYGMPALALTDRHSLTGAVEFYDACRAEGVRPILGLELTVDPGEHSRPVSRQLPPGSLVLLAQDLSGWASLCRLSSAAEARPGSAEPTATPLTRLAVNTEGLICLTAGGRGTLEHLAGDEPAAIEYLSVLAELFPGRMYVELHSAREDGRAVVEWLASMASRVNLPTVAANPVYHLSAREAGVQRLLTAIRLIRPLSALPNDAVAPGGSSFATPEEMAGRFHRYPEALEATADIALRCQLDLPLGAQRYPQIALPLGTTPEQALRQNAEAGARRLYGDPIPAEVQGRLEHELAIIGSQGYAPLFLIMQEIVGEAQRMGVPTASRGSAASSLVAHCLGVTSPDPMRLNLYFERFLNPARATPPDMDMDLCSRRREGVIQSVYRNYGDDRVATVCTISRFRRRSALREAAKAHGLSAPQIKELVDRVPYRDGGGPSGDGTSARQSAYGELLTQYPSSQYQRIFQDAEALLGLPRHLSVHPGGVVIAPGPMTDIAPTRMASKGVRITQFDLESIGRLGLLKIDLLGIRGLTVLGDVAEAGAKRERAKGGEAARESAGLLEFLEGIPEDDPATADLVCTGRTVGCFQIESPGMRATLREVEARSVDDLMAALALYRPGPLTGGLKDAFVRRHLGQEPVEHLHPSLAALLADTHGVILYQEQVLRIAHDLAGLGLAEADLLRRAMSHFDPGEKMRTLKEAFVAGAQTRSGMPRETGERIWDLMAAFAGYGFPKAHAASYALVAWRAAWCKAHYPAEFLAAVLANWGGYYGQQVYLAEARRAGLAVRPPHVNHSGREFSVSYDAGPQTSQTSEVSETSEVSRARPTLYMGLDQVRDLTRRTQTRIFRERPFASFSDFLARAEPRPQEAENLIKAGALEGLGQAPEMLHLLKSGGWQAGQMSLLEPESAGGADWSLAQRVAAEQEVLGVSVTAHPLELVADKLVDAEVTTSVEAAARAGQRVKVAGIRLSWRRTRSNKGEPVYWMSLEDTEGMLEAVIPSGVYRRHRLDLSPGHAPFVLEGIMEPDPQTGEPTIRVERIWRLTSGDDK